MKYNKLLTLIFISSLFLNGCSKKDESEVTETVEEVIEVTEESKPVYYDDYGNIIEDIENYTGIIYDENWNEVTLSDSTETEETSVSTEDTTSISTEDTTSISTENTTSDSTETEDTTSVSTEDTTTSEDITYSEGIDINSLKFRFPGLGINNEDLIINIDNSIIRNSRVLIPLESLNKFLPTVVTEYDDIREMITFRNNSNEYHMYLNTNVIYKNGISKINAEAKTTLSDITNTPLIPLKSIGSLFGMNIEYNQENNEIIVNGE